MRIYGYNPFIMHAWAETSSRIDESSEVHFKRNFKIAFNICAQLTIILNIHFYKCPPT